MLALNNIWHLLTWEIARSITNWSNHSHNNLTFTVRSSLTVWGIMHVCISAIKELKFSFLHSWHTAAGVRRKLNLRNAPGICQSADTCALYYAQLNMKHVCHLASCIVINWITWCYIQLASNQHKLSNIIPRFGYTWVYMSVCACVVTLTLPYHNNIIT